MTHLKKMHIGNQRVITNLTQAEILALTNTISGISYKASDTGNTYTGNQTSNGVVVGSGGGSSTAVTANGVRTGTNFVLTYDPSPYTLVNGSIVDFIPDVNYQAGDTVGGLVIREQAGGTLNALESNDMLAGGFYRIRYNGTQWVITGQADTQVQVVDNLTSTDIDKAASANTVKTLQDAKLTNLFLGNSVVGNAAAAAGAASGIAVAANQMLGRKSTGDLAAQTVTDIAYNLLDDANAFAMRQTLGAQGSAETPVILDWVQLTVLRDKEVRRATVAVGGFVVGQLIRSNSARASGILFDAAEAANWTGEIAIPATATPSVVKKETIHVANTTLAITEALHSNTEIHLEGTGNLTILNTDVTTDTFGFTVINTDAGATRTITPTGFDGVFIRDGAAAPNDLNGTAIPLIENGVYEFTMTLNSGFKYLNIKRLYSITTAATGQSADHVQVANLTTAAFANLTSVKFANTISGVIPYNSTTGNFSLTAGRTYNLQAQLRILSGNADFAWTDTAGALLVSDSKTDNAGGAAGGMLSNEVIYTPLVNMDVQFRVTAFASAVGNLGFASATITQIGSSAIDSATVQEKLVNQTNIKSVNGTTLLGSGNITTSADLDGGTNTTANNDGLATTGSPTIDTTTVAGQTIIRWTGSGSFTVPENVTSARVLVVGAGGGGGGGHAGGGGGAGRFMEHSALTITPGTVMTVVVGAGGTGSDAVGNGQTNGGNSSFGTITANGGGRGSGSEGATVSVTGGSGGGGSGGNSTACKAGSAAVGGSGGSPDADGAGFAGGNNTQGNTVYGVGAGGGGAGAAAGNVTGGNGSAGGAGGTGLNSDITGVVLGYAGGGGGGGWAAAGGTTTHGGGAGGSGATGSGINATANTGGGGGGSNASGTSRIGGVGGTGVVVIRFATQSRVYKALTAYADNTAALAGGLRAGQFFRVTSTNAVQQVV